MWRRRRMVVATAVTLLAVTGCAQPSTGPSASGERSQADGPPHAVGAPGADDGPVGDARDDADDRDRADAGPGSGVGPASSGDPADEQDAGARRDYPEGIVPVRVEIPAIGVDAGITDLSLAGSEPEVPQDFSQVGWYVQTREPGEIGPAVLAGHVDSRNGPAVFFELDSLQPGDEIVVTGEEGRRRFLVDDVGQYPKDQLPDEVFGFGDAQPQLRLITCGGSFDESSGHYRDNVVVYASRASAP